jgi:hypothetical protein
MLVAEILIQVCFCFCCFCSCLESSFENSTSLKRKKQKLNYINRPQNELETLHSYLRSQTLPTCFPKLPEASFFCF